MAAVNSLDNTHPSLYSKSYLPLLLQLRDQDLFVEDTEVRTLAIHNVLDLDISICRAGP